MHSKWLLVPLLAGLLGGCSSGESDQHVFQEQKQAIDKAKDVERLMKEQSDATQEKLDKL